MDFSQKRTTNKKLFDFFDAKFRFTAALIVMILLQLEKSIKFQFRKILFLKILKNDFSGWPPPRGPPGDTLRRSSICSPNGDIGVALTRRAPLLTGEKRRVSKKNAFPVFVT